MRLRNRRPASGRFVCRGPMRRRGVGAGLSWVARMGAVGGCCLLLAQCGQAPSGKLDPKYGVSASPRLVELGEPVPKGGGSYRVGKPYTSAGRTYVPEENPNYSAEGMASWYGDDFHGRETANGEVFDMDSITAAHPTLPMPSYARVTNLRNQTFDHRARQRPRAVSRQPRDRRVACARRSCSISTRTASRACGSSMSAAPRSKAPTTASSRRPCAAARRRRPRPRSGSPRRGRSSASLRADPIARRSAGAAGAAVRARPRPDAARARRQARPTATETVAVARAADCAGGGPAQNRPRLAGAETRRRRGQPARIRRMASVASPPVLRPANGLPTARACRPGVGLCRAGPAQRRGGERPRALLAVATSRHFHAPEGLLSISALRSCFDAACGAGRSWPPAGGCAAALAAPDRGRGAAADLGAARDPDRGRERHRAVREAGRRHWSRRPASPS